MNRKSLVRALVDPARAGPLQLPGFPSVETSAVVKLRGKYTFTVGTDNANVGYRLMLCKQPAYPLWGDVSHSGAVYTTSRYNLESGTASNDGTGGQYVGELGANTANQTTAGTPPSANFQWPAYSLRAGSGSPPWGTLPPVGAVGTDKRPFICMSADQSGTATTSFTVMFVFLRQSISTTGSITVPVRLVLDRWVGPGLVVQAVYNFTLSSWTVAPTSSLLAMATTDITSVPGWYRVSEVSVGSDPVYNPAVATGNPAPEFMDVTLCSTTVTFAWSGLTLNGTVTAGVDLVPLAPPYIGDGFSVTPIAAAVYNHLFNSRQTASAVAVTNYTKLMNKEGVISAARLPHGEAVYKYLKADLNVTPSKSYFGPLESGVYTYTVPATGIASWLDYVLVVYLNGTPTYVPCVNLGLDAECSCMSFSDADGGTSMMLQLDQHIEFVSSSQFWSPALCRTPVEVMHQAILDCYALGTFSGGPNPPFGRRAPAQAVLAAAVPSGPTASRPRRRRRPQQPSAPQPKKKNPKPKQDKVVSVKKAPNKSKGK